MSEPTPSRRAKPDSPTAMRSLIAQVRNAVPFDMPEAQICAGTCEGCSLKLLEFLGNELDGWEARLDAGERPGLKDLSCLANTSRKVYSVLARNGLAEGREESDSERA
ncbi:MAG: hypothetical protein MUC77_21910 [Chromatiaceae bacterium]|jgi:hypothetical protein|nr:hypothetical protein [Chromatiaceae bacterium]